MMEMEKLIVRQMTQPQVFKDEIVIKSHRKAGPPTLQSAAPQLFRRKPIHSEDYSVPAAAQESEHAETAKQRGDIRLRDGGEIQNQIVTAGSQ